MAIWTATNVSLPSNSRIVTVNTGDDVGQMYTGFIIQINDLQFKTVRTVNTGASPQTIELDELYTGASISGGSAIGAPTQGAIKEAAEELRQLRNSYEGLANSVNESGTANSLVRRTAQGRVKAADGVAVDDCVTMSQIGTAAARDVGTSDGNVIEVGSFGLGEGTFTEIIPDANSSTTPSGFFRLASGIANGTFTGAVINASRSDGDAFQIACERTNNNRFLVREFFSGAPKDWVEIYHSGNSVNPLDYGLGAGTTSTNLITDFGLNEQSGFYRSLGGYTDTPETVTFNSSVVVSPASTGTNFIYQRNVTSSSDIKAWLGCVRPQTGDVAWAELYHSGNSVNPKDYGISTNGTIIPSADDAELGSFSTSGQQTHAEAVANNLPDIGVGDNSLVWWNLQTFGNTGRRTQIATQVFAGGDKPDGDTYIRVRQDSVWRGWERIYTSSNTNFNEFGGESSTDYLGDGFIRNATVIRILLPINSNTPPVSITRVGAVTDFTVFDVQGDQEIDLTGAAIGLSPLSSSKVAVIEIGGLTGLTAGNTVLLQTSTASAKITVNF